MAADSKQPRADGIPRVYCAGPLFNRSEREEMTAIADCLEAAGFAVYLPHRDGMEFRKVHCVLVERDWPPAKAALLLHTAIFALDVYHLAHECGAMVWNLNGRVPDEGAVSEAAIAWTLGKPLIAYSDDVRSLIAGRPNPLLVGLVDFRTVNELETIPSALQQEIETTGQGGVARKQLPPKLRRTVARGGALWAAMNERDSQGNDERIADVVLELFQSEITR